MNIALLPLLVCPLMAAPQASPASMAAQSEYYGMPGAYQPVDIESPEVLEAKASIQDHFPKFIIDQVNEAYVQVVAGTNYKLVCAVLGDGQSAVWQFVVWHMLNGQWELTSARRVAND
jgi:hypothetical protein